MKSDQDELKAAFMYFAEETRGSSPLYRALSQGIAADPELSALLLEAAPSQRRANLLFSAVQFLLLKGRDHPLGRFYASLSEDAAPPENGAAEAFRDFCLSERTALKRLVATRRTQTNEVRRTGAFFPAIQALSAGTPVALLEMGASAGLNLLMDRYGFQYGDGPWLGDRESSVRIRCALKGAVPTQQRTTPAVGFRVGLDSSPLDVADEDDGLWLKACVWPEHQERRTLLEAAISVAKRHPPRIVAGDAVDDLEMVLDTVPEYLPVCLFHSATLTYLPKEQRAAFVAKLDEAAGRRRMSWLSLEGRGVRPFDGPHPSEDRVSAREGELILGSWAKGKRKDRLLARVDMHGRWIAWEAE